MIKNLIEAARLALGIELTIVEGVTYTRNAAGQLIEVK